MGWLQWGTFRRAQEAILGQDESPALVGRGRPFPTSALSTPTRSVAGVDGCKGGWVVVRRDEVGRFYEPQVVESLNCLRLTDLILIDIPIGIPERGRRDCDRAARTKLGPRRGRSVFTGARRPLLSKTSRESAHAWGRKLDCLGVNKQLWAIVPKIREVNVWITPDRNRTVREGHPELSFYVLAGQPMEHSKKTAKGRCERVNVLAEFVDRQMIEEWLKKARGSGAAPDDILDALALCLSATRLALGCHLTLPSCPPRDACDLAMEMVF